ncbi:hypothetical protein BDN71DRAFT_1443579, partial [Pleurotus eryngii]
MPNRSHSRTQAKTIPEPCFSIVTRPAGEYQSTWIDVNGAAVVGKVLTLSRTFSELEEHIGGYN